jgi:hypothetical protein
MLFQKGLDQPRVVIDIDAHELNVGMICVLVDELL